MEFSLALLVQQTDIVKDCSLSPYWRIHVFPLLVFTSTTCVRHPVGHCLPSAVRGKGDLIVRPRICSQHTDTPEMLNSIVPLYNIPMVDPGAANPDEERRSLCCYPGHGRMGCFSETCPGSIHILLLLPLHVV